MVERASEQVTRLREEADPSSPRAFELGEPRPLERKRDPVSDLLQMFRVEMVEPVRLGGRGGEHACHPALGQERNRHQGPGRGRFLRGGNGGFIPHGNRRIVPGGRRRIGGAGSIGGEPAQIVVDRGQPGRTAHVVGRLRESCRGPGEAGQQLRVTNPRACPYPQLAVLVGDERVRGVGARRVTGGLHGVPQQFVVAEPADGRHRVVSLVREHHPSRAVSGVRGGPCRCVPEYLAGPPKAGLLLGRGSLSDCHPEPDCLRCSRVAHAPRRGEGRRQHEPTAVGSIGVFCRAVRLAKRAGGMTVPYGDLDLAAVQPATDLELCARVDDGVGHKFAGQENRVIDEPTRAIGQLPRTERLPHKTPCGGSGGRLRFVGRTCGEIAARLHMPSWCRYVMSDAVIVTHS